MGPGASRKPSVPPTRPPAGAPCRLGTREPRPPPAAGARAPPSPRPVPKLGKLFNPFRAASVPWTQPLVRGSGGGLGAAAPWEVSVRFRNGGSGQAGTVWQLSGRPPESESDSPAADIALGSISALGSRLPHSPGCDRLGGGGGPGEVRPGAWERDPAGILARGREDFPLPHRSASFDFWPLLPGRGRPGKASTNLRDPGAHLIPAHLRARLSRAGAGRVGPCSSRIRPGLLHRARLGQIQGFLLTAPTSPQVSLCRVPISCCPWATPRAGLHPPPPCAFPPAPPRAQVSQRRSIFLD